jgi:hypothetical protein
MDGNFGDMKYERDVCSSGCVKKIFDFPLMAGLLKIRSRRIKYVLEKEKNRPFHLYSHRVLKTLDKQFIISG